MHNSSDENGVRSDLINHPVWKTLEDAAPGAFGKWRPRFRKLDDAFQSTFDLYFKLIAEAFALVVIIINRFLQFDFSDGEKLDLHRDYFLRFLSNTRWAGIAAISPRSYASMRSSTSSAHISSIDFDCGNSKLDSRRSINSARSSGGKVKAWEKICSACSDMTTDLSLKMR